MSSTSNGIQHSHHHRRRRHDHVNTDTDANKEHFDASAYKYERHPGVQELARRLACAMRDAYNFVEDETTVLDFACGTGEVHYLTGITVVGVDISQAMIDVYNMHVTNHGILPEEMHAMCTELKGVDGEQNNTVRFPSLSGYRVRTTP